MIDLSQKLTEVIAKVAASVQVTGHKSRIFSLAIDYGDCTIADVVRKAASEDRIAWQNTNRAKGEAHMSALPGSIVIKAKPPGVRGPVDIEAAYMGKMQAASVDDLDVQIAKLTAMKNAKAHQQSFSVGESISTQTEEPESKPSKPAARPGREAK